MSLSRLAILMLFLFSGGCGCSEEKGPPFFLKRTPIAPRSAAGVSEESLGVPLYPGAKIDEDATIRKGKRLRLLYRLNDLPQVVVNFYERRLRAIASKSNGTTGNQYFLVKVLPNGTRTTVIIEALLKDGKEAGSIVRILHEEIKPIRRTTAPRRGK